MDRDQQLDSLKAEILRLFELIQKIKQEIASIKHPKASTDHFNTVADQLNAIVGTTEMATQDIMEATEAIQNAAAEVRSHPEAAAFAESLGKINDATGRIFESCSFHDLTGQRISRIVRTMNAIEGTLNQLVVIVGEQGLAALPLAEKKVEQEDECGTPLHGPALEGQGFSQEDIDKLFD